MRLLPVVLAWAGVLTACTASSGGGSVSGGSPSTPSGRTSTTSASPTAIPAIPSPPASAGESSGPSFAPAPSATAPQDPAERALAHMSLARRVGQLIMVDCPSSGIASATRDAIRRDHAGSVILDGTSHLGVEITRAITDQVQSLAPPGVGLFVATDQEGGLVQRLQGQGFTDIPSAVDQSDLSVTQIRSSTRRWAGQLRAAGVNVDLAPVLDTVPAGGGANPPIGDLDREYGHDPRQVGDLGTAVVRGLADAGVAATAKHFPGLGRVSANTDTSPDVTDDVTTANDPYLAPFRRAIAAGVPFVMMSTAVYPRIDPDGPALFSRAIVTDLLRDRLGFRGIVITDDIGIAKQVADLSPAQRAVRFVEAGGTMLLTVDASIVGEMTRALADRARHDPRFLDQVDAAALLVLRTKQRYGLLG